MKNFLPLAVADPWPTWDNQINSSGRFQVLSQFDSEAVLDKETGLVWEQAPDPNTRTWIHAQTHCYIRNVVGRKGWRYLPLKSWRALWTPSKQTQLFRSITLLAMFS